MLYTESSDKSVLFSSLKQLIFPNLHKRSDDTSQQSISAGTSANDKTFVKLIDNIYSTYSKAEVVRSGVELVKPFLLEHELRNKQTPSTEIRSKREIYNICSISILSLFYRTHVNIGHTHVCMGSIDQQLPLNIVKQILLHTLQYIGIDNGMVDNVSCYDIFMQLCLAIHEIHGNRDFYRDDISGMIIPYIFFCFPSYILMYHMSITNVFYVPGEDISTRFGFSARENDPVKSYFRGGDCEDWAQTYIQIYNTICANLYTIIQEREFIPYTGLLIMIFSFNANRQKPCLARGIFVYTKHMNNGENVKEDHHTFNIVLHKNTSIAGKSPVYISVIENVIPTFIVPPGFDYNFIEELLSDTTKYDHVKAFVVSSGKAKKSYETVTWMAENMLFEYNSVSKRLYHCVSTYTQYNRVVYIQDDNDLDMFKNSLSDTTVSGVWMICLNPNMLCAHHDFFLTFSVFTKSMFHTPAYDFTALGNYFKFMDVFVRDNIKQLYNENTIYVNKMADAFLTNYSMRILHTPQDTTCLSKWAYKIGVFTIILAAWCDNDPMQQKHEMLSYKGRHVVVLPIIRPQLGIIMNEIRKILSQIQESVNNVYKSKSRLVDNNLDVYRKYLLDLIHEQLLVGQIGDIINETTSKIISKCNIVKQLFVLFVSIRNMLRYQHKYEMTHTSRKSPIDLFSSSLV